jgi:hypothetical protein
MGKVRPLSRTAALDADASIARDPRGSAVAWGRRGMGGSLPSILAVLHRLRRPASSGDEARPGCHGSRVWFFDAGEGVDLEIANAHGIPGLVRAFLHVRGNGESSTTDFHYGPTRRRSLTGLPGYLGRGARGHRQAGHGRPGARHLLAAHRSPWQHPGRDERRLRPEQASRHHPLPQDVPPVR